MIFMIMMASDIRGGWGISFPDICLTFEEKSREKSLNQENCPTGIEPGPAIWEATAVAYGIIDFVML